MASLSCSDLRMVPCPLTQKETESHCSTVPKNGESWKLLLLQERTSVFLSSTLCLKLIFRWSVISLSWSSCLVFILEKTSVPRHISREDHGFSLGEVPSRWQMPPNPQHGASLVLSSHTPARTWNLGDHAFPQVQYLKYNCSCSLPRLSSHSGCHGFKCLHLLPAELAPGFYFPLGGGRRGLEEGWPIASLVGPDRQEWK